MPLLPVLLLLGAACRAAPPDDDDLSRLPAHFLADTRAQFDLVGLSLLSVSAGASAAVRPSDGGVKAGLLSARPLGHGAAAALTEGGDGLVLLPLSAAFYAGGRLGNAPWAADLGMESFEALALSGVEAGILKYSVGRERPDGADHYSFPSGHTTAAFSVASVLAGEYGWKAGIPAFAAASAVGYSRLELNKHWLSDVVFGAGLGIASGRAVVLAKRRRRREGLAWAPYFAPGSLGVAVAF